MTTLQMQYLIALADHMSITRAAAALFIYLLFRPYKESQRLTKTVKV